MYMEEETKAAGNLKLWPVALGRAHNNHKSSNNNNKRRSFNMSRSQLSPRLSPHKQQHHPHKNSKARLLLLQQALEEQQSSSESLGSSTPSAQHQHPPPQQQQYQVQMNLLQQHVRSLRRLSTTDMNVAAAEKRRQDRRAILLLFFLLIMSTAAIFLNLATSNHRSEEYAIRALEETRNIGDLLHSPPPEAPLLLTAVEGNETEAFDSTTMVLRVNHDEQDKEEEEQQPNRKRPRWKYLRILRIRPHLRGTTTQQQMES